MPDLAVSFRLSLLARQLLLRLSERWGVSQRAVLEQLIRKAAQAEGLWVPDADPSPTDNTD